MTSPLLPSAARPATENSPGPSTSTSAQDRWILAGVTSALRRLVEVPPSVLEISTRPMPRLQDHAETAGIDFGTVMVDHNGSIANVEDREYDLAISIAVLGWIADDQARAQAIKEHLRTARCSILVNVDWSVAEGGPAFNRLRDLMSTTLGPKGFNPYYGLLQHCEVSLIVTGRGRAVTDAVAIDSSLHPGVMLEAAGQILAGLQGRDLEFAAQLTAATRREIEVGVRCRLPDIVATIFRPDDEAAAA